MDVFSIEDVDSSMGVSAQPLINKASQIIAIASVVGEFFIWSSLKCIQKFNIISSARKATTPVL